jgi:hypothetical protein
MMRRRRERRLDEAFVEYPLQSLAALAICVFIGICFVSVFVSTPWTVVLGLPIGIGLWLVGAASVGKDLDGGWFEK